MILFKSIFLRVIPKEFFRLVFFIRKDQLSIPLWISYNRVNLSYCKDTFHDDVYSIWKLFPLGSLKHAMMRIDRKILVVFFICSQFSRLRSGALSFACRAKSQKQMFFLHRLHKSEDVVYWYSVQYFKCVWIGHVLLRFWDLWRYNYCW